MTEKMYDDLMEHIDNLELWGVFPTVTAILMRKYAKEIEDCAIIFYNHFFSTEIPQPNKRGN